MVLFRLGVDAYAPGAGLAQPRLGRRGVGCGVEAFQPGHGIVDFFRIKAYRAEFALQMGRLGAGVASVVVFVNKDKHFKHAANIAQNIGAG